MNFRHSIYVRLLLLILLSGSLCALIWVDASVAGPELFGTPSRPRVLGTQNDLTAVRQRLVGTSTRRPLATVTPTLTATASQTPTPTITPTRTSTPTATRTPPAGINVLLVDDDDNNPDVRNYYTAALNGLNIPYTIWNTANSDSNEPQAADLAVYEIVIWFSGHAFGGSAGPGAAGEAALGDWMDNSGCLLLSSQDYYYDHASGAPTAFMSNYLGLASVSEDQKQTSIAGYGLIFWKTPYTTLKYPFTNHSDSLTPADGAELALLGDQGGAALTHSGARYHAAFWGFPFEALPTLANRMAALDSFVEWCLHRTPVLKRIYMPYIRMPAETSTVFGKP